MFEIKKIEENKILTSNLKARMFRGYHKVLKNSKNKSCKKNLKNLKFYSPQNKMNKEPSYTRTYSNGFISKNKVKKEILPFENEYQEIYKTKYLHKLNNIKLNELDVINFSKNNQKWNIKNKKMFLTETKNLKSYPNISNNAQGKKMNNNKIDKTIRDLNILFPYKDEINKFSNLPFFSLTKNPYNLQSNPLGAKNGNKNIKDILQEDFLYKISHQRENEYKGINNNFNKNKGLKKGFVHNINDINYDNNKKNLKFELDVKNLNDNKHEYLTSKERRYKIVEKEIQPFKNIVSLFKDFETKILSDEKKNNPDNNDINFDENKTEENMKNNILSNVCNNIKQYYINQRHFDFDEPYRTTYNFKKPKLYPINYYSFNQLQNKEKKYEKAHKLAFQEFQKKINLKEDDKKAKSVKKELDEYEKAYFNKLYIKKPVTNKTVFMHECRNRDIIITNKLKCEFSPTDIKRVLNGQKPWNDCESLDEKFLSKNLPSSVDEYMKNKKK